jgi:hypothetical protein
MEKIAGIACKDKMVVVDGVDAGSAGLVTAFILPTR